MTWTDGSGLVTYLPDEPLVAGTGYVAALVRPMEDGFPSVAFVVGDRPSDPPTIPSMEVSQAVHEEADCGHNNFVEFAVGGGNRRVEVEVTSGGDAMDSFHTVNESFYIGFHECVGVGTWPVPGTTVVARARGVSMNGVEVSEWSEPITYEVPEAPEGCGCAASSVAPGWAALGVVGLIWRRRTARRPPPSA